jgi:hypothetical protein
MSLIKARVIRFRFADTLAKYQRASYPNDTIQ